MTHWGRHLRHAARRLRKAPLFLLLCVGTLAVAIGANGALFSVIDGVLLRPLPYSEPDRLIGLWHRAPGLGMEQVPQSIATYRFYRDHAESLQSIALYNPVQVNLTGEGLAERIDAARVTPSLFRVLGTVPTTGRTLAAQEEDSPQTVAVISDRLWQERFAGRPEVVGASIRLDGVRHEILGVLPRSFDFPHAETDVWLPMEMPPGGGPLARFSAMAVARLAPGMTLEQARLDLENLMSDLPAAFPEDPAAAVLERGGFAPMLHPLRQDLVGDIGDSLWTLLGAVGFLLLIACINLANLLNVRIESRRRETALRSALGAPRGQLMAGVLSESLVLAFLGGLTGLVLAWIGVRVLKVLDPSTVPRLEAVVLDARVVLFTAVITLLATLLFSLVPALGIKVARPAEELKSGDSRSGPRRRLLGRRALVVLQLALSLILLIGSGLMARSFWRLNQVDPGFRTSGALTFELALPPRSFPSDTASAQRFQQIVQQLESLPEIEVVGATSILPLAGSSRAEGHVIDGVPLEEGAPPPVIDVAKITPGYLAAMGIPVLEGRSLRWSDVEQRTGVALVSRSLARRYWPNESAVGKRLRPGRGVPGLEDPWYEIVGVVGDVRGRLLTEPPQETVYYPLLGKAAGAWVVHTATLVVASPLPTSQLLPSVRREMSQLAPDLPLAQVRSVEESLARARGRLRFTLLLFLLATAIALFLAVVGTYGFITYLVEQRRSEIGVRMVLGADSRSIRNMVVGEGLIMGAVGMGLGLVGAWALTRWLRALLFEVDALDPLVFVLVPAVLLSVVVLASLRPARRAARLDPAQALLRG